ncbi:MAG: flagellar export chaperone FliS [Acidobacteriota bacterium]
MGSAQQAYFESRVLSADPLELVELLYEAAIESVAAARRHLRAGEIAARSHEISRTCEILMELQGSVDREAGGALAANLIELYDYMQRRLIRANCEQADAPLAEVSNLLATLLEGWTACRPQPGTEAPAAGEDAEAEYSSQSWVA